MSSVQSTKPCPREPSLSGCIVSYSVDLQPALNTQPCLPAEVDSLARSVHKLLEELVVRRMLVKLHGHPCFNQFLSPSSQAVAEEAACVCSSEMEGHTLSALRFFARKQKTNMLDFVSQKMVERVGFPSKTCFLFEGKPTKLCFCLFFVFFWFFLGIGRAQCCR